jgi:hypothetical protein
MFSRTSPSNLSKSETYFSKYILIVAPEDDVPEVLNIILDPFSNKKIHP